MRSALLLFWALAPCLAILNPRGPIQSLSRRDVVEQSTTTQFSEEHIVTSFSQVTETYTSIRSSFVETSQTLYSQTSFEQVRTTLTRFQTSIEEAVTSISGGCDCDAAGINTKTIESTVFTWFSQLQYMVQLCQQRFPSQLSTLTTTFTQISTHLQVALGVAYVSGVDIQPIVTRVFQRARIDQRVFSSVQIKTTSFTQISEAVTHKTGTFVHVPTPVGRRFPKLLTQALTTARKSGAGRNGTLPVDSTHARVNGSTTQLDNKLPMPSTDGLPHGTAPNSTEPVDGPEPVDGHVRPKLPTESLTHGTGPNSTLPASDQPDDKLGKPFFTPSPNRTTQEPNLRTPDFQPPNTRTMPGHKPEQPPLTRDSDHSSQETNPYRPGYKPPTQPPTPDYKHLNPIEKPTGNSGDSGSPGPDYQKKPVDGDPFRVDRQPSRLIPVTAPWNAQKPAPGDNIGRHPGRDSDEVPATGRPDHAGGFGTQPGSFSPSFPTNHEMTGGEPGPNSMIPERVGFQNTVGSNRGGAPPGEPPLQVSANHGMTDVIPGSDQSRTGSAPTFHTPKPGSTTTAPTTDAGSPSEHHPREIN